MSRKSRPTQDTFYKEKKYIIPCLMCVFVRRFMYFVYLYLLNHLFILLFMYLFYLLVYSFVRSFASLFVDSFINLLIQWLAVNQFTHKYRIN